MRLSHARQYIERKSVIHRDVCDTDLHDATQGNEECLHREENEGEKTNGRKDASLRKENRDGNEYTKRIQRKGVRVYEESV
jgi:hypothetical protein